MRLEGLHHITMITGDAQSNVAFYADVLGLRLVKKTVNFDDPSAYHLYFGDETGAPGSILTWFEFAGAAPGRAGIGMIHTLQLGVPQRGRRSTSGSSASTAKGANPTRVSERSLKVADPDGLQLELVVADDGNPPLQAAHPEVPAEHAITGLEGARAYSMFHGVEEKVLTDVLGFEHLGGGEYRVQGERAPLPLGLRRGAGLGAAVGRGHGPPHRVGVAGRRPPQVAGAGRARPTATSPTSRTATTSTPSTSASRAACCSRSPRCPPASRSTRTPSTSARSCGCPSSTSTCAPSWSARCSRSSTRASRASVEVTA